MRDGDGAPVPDAVLDPFYKSGSMYGDGSWDSPLFKVFDNPPLISASVQGLHYYCTYYNDPTLTGLSNNITFGGHADVQEHCNLFVQYYYEPNQDGTPFDPVKQGYDPLHCAEGSGGW